MNREELFVIQKLRVRKIPLQEGDYPNDIFLEDQSGRRVASLLRKANIKEGYEIIPDFTPTEGFINEATTLQGAFFLVKDDIEKIIGLEILI
jgi:hypothetical protein